MDQPILYFLAAVWILALIIGLGVYILEAFAFYHMFKKAGTRHPWLAFIPIAQAWPFLWTIKKSAWNLLYLVVPVLGGGILSILIAVMAGNSTGSTIAYILFGACYLFSMIIYFIWQTKFFKAFGMSPVWILLVIGSMIPYIGGLAGIGLIILFCIMGFSKTIYYDPDFDI